MELDNTTVWRLYRALELCLHSAPFFLLTDPWMIALVQGSDFLTSPQALTLHLGHQNNTQGWRDISVTGVYLSHQQNVGPMKNLFMECCLSIVAAQPQG